MTKLPCFLLISVLLAACGGGSDSPSGAARTPSANASDPDRALAQPGADRPTPPRPVTLSTPPTATGVKITARTVNQGGSAANWQTAFSGAVNLNVTGGLNNFWVSAAASGGAITVAGDQNTFVLAPSAQPATISVSGTANTFYVPEGTELNLEGSGAALTTVKYYKPVP